MSYWNLTEEIKNKFKPIVEEYLNQLENEEITEEQWDGIDLTNKGINPIQLKELLEEEFGYEDDCFDSNGWEHDFWQYMNNDNRKNYAKKLCIGGCGMTFELNLYPNWDE